MPIPVSKMQQVRQYVRCVWKKRQPNKNNCNNRNNSLYILYIDDRSRKPRYKSQKEVPDHKRVQRVSRHNPSAEGKRYREKGYYKQNPSTLMAEQFLKIRLHGSILQLKPSVCKMGNLPLRQKHNDIFLGGTRLLA